MSEEQKPVSSEEERKLLESVEGMKGYPVPELVRALASLDKGA